MDLLLIFFRIVATVNKLTILPLFSACWVSSCFHNPPNSDMGYKIFYVRTFLCVRIHTGVDGEVGGFNGWVGGWMDINKWVY